MITLEPIEQAVRNGLLSTTILTLALAGLTGCGDEVTDPDAFLESAEAEAILQSARALPMLPELMDRVDPAPGRDDAVLVRARELWVSGSRTGRQAETRRRLAVSYALPVLVESLQEDDWTRVRDGVDGWIATAETMLQHLSMARLDERTRVARRYLARADAVRDDVTRQRFFLLLAVSELVETTPAFVARSMVDDAAIALERLPEPERNADRRALERATRLKDWAEQAVDEGDYLLAIQRAYYAIQLVEGQ